MKKPSRYLLAFMTILVCTGAPGFLLAVKIKGTVYDPSGALVPGARVMLMKDYVKQQETSSGARGEFILPDVEPGQYQLQIKKERFGLFQQTIDVAPEKDLDFWAVVPLARIFEQVAIRSSRAGTRTPGTGNRRVPPLGGVVQPPELLVPLKARYADKADGSGIQGAVVVYAHVRLDGTLANPIVIDSPDPSLEAEILRALPSVRYAPARLNGKPIESDIVLVTDFRIE